MKNRWIHYAKHIQRGDPCYCGKIYGGNGKMDFSQTKDKITCRRCLKKMKKEFWFCPEHGFLSNESVTFEERCEICGENV